MYYLFLDDTRLPRQVTWVQLPENVPWVHARSYSDFIQAIDKFGVPKFVAYDCDLCEEHYEAYFKLAEKYPAQHLDFKNKCGIHCLQYLLDVCKKKKIQHPTYVIHTKNHYAKPFMEDMITQFNIGVLPQNNVIEDVCGLEVYPIAKTHKSSIPAYARYNESIISGFFGSYRYLSNFWPALVEWKGLTFPSVEVAYQAAKCVNPEGMADFLKLTPAEAKRLGNKVSVDLKEWEYRKYQVMHYLLMQKFSRHVDLRRLLQRTGTKTLIEANSWKDQWWGVYYSFDAQAKEWICVGGKNRLGEALENVRDILG